MGLRARLNQPIDEELNKATAEAGLPASPNTVAGAKTLGVSQKSAEMAASPQSQRRSQLESQRAQPQEAGLAYQQRMEQARANRTQAEQAAAAKSQQLQQLGSLGSRVDDLLKAKFAAETAEPLKLVGDQASISVDSSTIAGVDTQNRTPEELAKVEQDINAILDPNTTPEERAKLFFDLKGTEFETFTEKQFEALYGDVSQLTSSLSIEAIGNELAVEQFKAEDWEALGIEGPDAMAVLLGVEPSEMGAMTVNQIVDKVQEIQGAEYETMDNMRQQMASPATSDAEREELRRAFRNAAGVGMSGIEYEMESLGRAMESADKVMINGKEFSYEEALSDEVLGDSIEAFLASTDEKEIAKYEEFFGKEFADFLRTHKQGIATTIASVAGEYESFVGVQQANSDLLVRGGFSDTENANLIGYMYGDLAGGSPADMSGDIGALGIGQYMAEHGDPLDEDLRNKLIDFADNENIPESAKLELSQLSFEQVQALLDEKGKGLDEFIIQAQAAAGWKDIVDSAATGDAMDDVLDAIFGKDVQVHDVGSLMARYKWMADNNQLSGAARSNYEALKAVLDLDGDGVLDDDAAIAGRIAVGSPSLLNNDWHVGKMADTSLVLPENADPKLAPFPTVSAGGKISSSNLRQNIGVFDYSDLKQMASGQGTYGQYLSPQAMKVAEAAWTQQAEADVDAWVSKHMGSTISSSSMVHIADSIHAILDPDKLGALQDQSRKWRGKDDKMSAAIDKQLASAEMIQEAQADIEYWVQKETGGQFGDMAELFDIAYGEGEPLSAAEAQKVSRGLSKLHFTLKKQGADPAKLKLIRQLGDEYHDMMQSGWREARTARRKKFETAKDTKKKSRAKTGGF